MSNFVVAAIGSAALWIFDAPAWAFVLLIAQATFWWFTAFGVTTAIEEVARRIQVVTNLTLATHTELLQHVNTAKGEADAMFKRVEHLRNTLADLNVPRHSRPPGWDSDD